jgi:hypothetical protein
VVIVPFLTLLLGVDIRYAIGASLVSVIATSSGAATAFLREGYTNIRVGMLLEIATTAGATLGAIMVSRVPTQWIAILFGLVLLSSAFYTATTQTRLLKNDKADPLAMKLRLDATVPTADGIWSYHVHSLPLGFLLMGVAGALSGLLGIGSGAMKVLAMDRVMRLPFKVSTTTSNFMIGVTAAAGAGIYLNKGYIDPGLAMPVILGVLPGSIIGSRLLARVRAKSLRILFGLVVLALGIQMIIVGMRGGM